MLAVRLNFVAKIYIFKEIMINSKIFKLVWQISSSFSSPSSPSLLIHFSTSFSSSVGEDFSKTISLRIKPSPRLHSCQTLSFTLFAKVKPHRRRMHPVQGLLYFLTDLIFVKFAEKAL